MLELHSVRPYAETCFASGYWRRDPSAQYKPRHNQLLAALSPMDYERLLPHLEPVALPLGLTVHCAGERERHCYFLTAGIVSRVYVMESGASAETAVTGTCSISRNKSRWPSVTPATSVAHVPANIRTSTTGARKRFAASDAQAHSKAVLA